MKSSKRVVKAALGTALVFAMGVTTLFTHAGSSYAAGEAKLNKTSRNILTQRSFDFDVTGAPADAVVTWKSSDEKTATVDANGVVTGIKKGNVTITCEITAAGEPQKLTAEVKVRKPAVKIEIKNKITELEYGKTYDLNRTLTPKTSNDVTTWKSSNTKIATVDANGVVKALADGTVTITATTMSGRSDSVEITVFGAPEPTKAPEATATPVPTKKPDAPKPTQKPSAKQEVVYEESFEKGVGDWVKRGNSTVNTKKSVSSPDGTQYLAISGRTANWHGGAISMNAILELGGTYSASVWVKQDSADGEVIKVTGQKNSSSYPNVGSAVTNKGEWTEITGTITVDADTKDYLLYVEADNLIDICVDKVVIKKVSGGTGKIEKTEIDGATDFSGDNLWYYAHWKSQEPVKQDDGFHVAYDEQYGEAVFTLTTPVALGDFASMYVKFSATDALAIKAYDENGEQITFWWSRNSKNLAIVELDYASTGYNGNAEISADLLSKKVARVGIMAQNGACDAVIQGVGFVPKN